MPKSKRNKIVSLTQVKKDGKGRKENLVESIRTAADEYPVVFVFRFKNMRNVAFKRMRDEIKDTTKFFLGSNKVMQVALGKDETTGIKENIHELSERLSGIAGLCFTQLNKREMEAKIAEYEELDYARPGQCATETVEFSAGPVMGSHGAPMAHTLEPTLRTHGMPTKLNHGVVELIACHTVCKKGDVLSPHACALLRIFDYKMARFEMILDSYYLCGDGTFAVLNEPEDDELADLGDEFEIEYRDSSEMPSR